MFSLIGGFGDHSPCRRRGRFRWGSASATTLASPGTLPTSAGEVNQADAAQSRQGVDHEAAAVAASHVLEATEDVRQDEAADPAHSANDTRNDADFFREAQWH